MSQYGWTIWASLAGFTLTFIWVAISLLIVAITGLLNQIAPFAMSLLVAVMGVVVVLFTAWRFAKYWMWLGIRCRCFGCLKSNRVFFVSIHLDALSVMLQPWNQSYWSHPAPICRHCGADLREMLLDDDLK